MADHNPDDAVPDVDTCPAFDRSARACPVILALMWIAILVTGARVGWDRRAVSGTDAPPGTLNPNRAAWCELTLLPRIGESKARAVVDYRSTRQGEDSGPAFARPSDLIAVKGIGPKTAQRVAKELRFDD